MISTHELNVQFERALRECMVYFGAVGVLAYLTDFVATLPEFREPIERALVEVQAVDPVSGICGISLEAEMSPAGCDADDGSIQIRQG